jgi:hypothetical protein
MQLRVVELRLVMLASFVVVKEEFWEPELAR